VELDVLGRYHGDNLPTFRASEYPDALAFLLGAWRVERHLADHRSGARGTFDGTASWLPPGQELSCQELSYRELSCQELGYREQGELCFGGHRGPASRSLIYRAGPDGAADVCFADGREFYRLDPRPGQWRAQHQCGRDLYEVTGRLLGAGTFEERWRARGPDKDYEITTTLVRDGHGRRG
jgi:hypothetical protein